MRSENAEKLRAPRTWKGLWDHLFYPAAVVFVLWLGVSQLLQSPWLVKVVLPLIFVIAIELAPHDLRAGFLFDILARLFVIGATVFAIVELVFGRP